MSINNQDLKNIVHYDETSGAFTWLKSGKGVPKSRSAGTKNAAGYVQIQIKGRLYYAHRLAWLYMTGEWPKGQIDHVNLCKDDNSWSNLREAEEDQNKWNLGLSRHNKSGVKGVSFDQRTQRWRVRVCVSGACRSAGYFDSIEDAARAASDFRKLHHGSYARDAISASQQ